MKYQDSAKIIAEVLHRVLEGGISVFEDMEVVAFDLQFGEAYEQFRLDAPDSPLLRESYENLAVPNWGNWSDPDQIVHELKNGLTLLLSDRPNTLTVRRHFENLRSIVAFFSEKNV